METPLSKLGFLIFGTYVGICALLFNAKKIHCLHGNGQVQSLLLKNSPPAPAPPTSPKPPPPLHPPPHAPLQPNKTNDSTNSSKPSSNGSHRANKKTVSTPPSAGGKMNTGKIVGLSFLAFAVVMQIAVIGFLAIKRRQLV